MTLDKKTRLKEMMEIYRSLIPKTDWHDNEDIYELNGADGLLVYGENGRFYQFNYKSDDRWTITEAPYDMYNRKKWLGFGKGWVDKKTEPWYGANEM